MADIKKVPGGFQITRKPCIKCGEPPFGEEYACGHSQTPPTRRVLTESERSTITNGLRVAAERFKGHWQGLQNVNCPDCLDKPGKDGLGRTCKKCRGTGEIPETKLGNLSLAKQFERQYSDSIMLAQQIDDAESVEVTL
jgi:hypothetical protein